MFAKEFDCALPRISRSFSVVNLRARVVEESVIRVRVYLHFDLLAEIFHFAFKFVNRLRRDKASFSA
jgi:hypothetical protein